jgi:hypothetical protein
MRKNDRISIFDERVLNVACASSPGEVWKNLSELLREVEDEYTPDGCEKMTILELSNENVQPYGLGGYMIPLIGYEILINANGAFRIKNIYKSSFNDFCNRDSTPFEFIIDSTTPNKEN